MPYVSQYGRAQHLLGCPPHTVGDLNYAITRLVDQFLVVSAGDVTYTNVNAVIGVLECAKLELYRRIAAPFEDKKCAENGDVYVAKP